MLGGRRSRADCARLAHSGGAECRLCRAATPWGRRRRFTRCVVCICEKHEGYTHGVCDVHSARRGEDAKTGIAGPRRGAFRRRADAVLEDIMVNWRHGEANSPGDVSRISHLPRIPPSQIGFVCVSSDYIVFSADLARLLKLPGVRNRACERVYRGRDSDANEGRARRETADGGCWRPVHALLALPGRTDGGRKTASGCSGGERQGERCAGARAQSDRASDWRAQGTRTEQLAAHVEQSSVAQLPCWTDDVACATDLRALPASPARPSENY